MPLIEKTVAAAATVEKTVFQKLTDALATGKTDLNLRKGAGRASNQWYLVFEAGGEEIARVSLGSNEEGASNLSHVRTVMEAMQKELATNLSQLPSVEELRASEAGTPSEGTASGEVVEPEVSEPAAEETPAPRKRR